MKRTRILWALLAVLVIPALTEARVTRIEITRQEPFANGMPFGKTGPYVKLVGTAYMEVDPDDPRNSVIQDLDLVPTNAAGNVEFSTDLYILKPVDMRKGNGKIFFEVNNRGNKISLILLHDTPPGSNINDPTTPSDAGNGFLMREGYTIVWTGWEADVLRTNTRMSVDLPVATINGTEIIGTLAVQFTATRHFPLTGAVSLTLNRSGFDSYETVSLDTSSALFTMRDLQSSPETVIPGWAFATCERNPETGMIENIVPSTKNICYFDGFDPDRLYQLVYTAKNPKPMALGYAATRDVASFLRYGSEDDTGSPNPIGTAITNAYCMGISSSGMYVRDFTYLGFNEDETGRKVFDGIMAHIPGAFRLHMNTRFTMPDIYSRQDLWAGLWPMATFPFSYGITTDPITGRTDGILKRPTTDPVIIHSDTSTEYWQFHASLVTHDSLGNPISLPENVRYYLLSSAQHFTTVGAPPSLGICEQLSNPLHTGVFVRALLVAMDQWITKGIQPPPSRFPIVTNGTLVGSDQTSTGFPSIPEVTYSGLINELSVNDYGPNFGPMGGVITTMPPLAVPGTEHTVLVPKVDADGNDLAGLRRPDDIQTPLATHTGWNHRREGVRNGDLCGLTGMYIPFAETQDERLASGDPRLSVEERYKNHGGYVKRVVKAAKDLKAQRLLLQEDVAKIIKAAAQRDVLR